MPKPVRPIVALADLEPADAERRREGPEAVAEDDGGERVQHDEQPQGQDHGVDLRLALDRPDDHPLDDGAEHEARDAVRRRSRASRSGRRRSASAR